MNYLRSVVLLASSASLVALIAGCNADVADDVAPSTEVEKGVQPKAVAGSICVQDVGGTDKDAAFLQVQASRVAKYLFGGNDPFSTEVNAYGKPVAWSKEFGTAGTKSPDLANADCRDGVDLIHKLHDKIYPPPSKDCIEQAKGMRAEWEKKYGQYVGKEEYADKLPPVPVPACYDLPGTAWVESGPLDTACHLPADTFGVNVPDSDPDIDKTVMEKAAVLLDGCWGKGISGFLWVDTGYKTPPSSGSTTPTCDPKQYPKGCPEEEGRRPGPIKVNIFGTDPGPADLKAPLFGSSGATADAVFTNTTVATKVLLWPGTYTSGNSSPAGTPCNTIGMGTGERTTKQIVVNLSGTQRKCI
jgi:hypothetical protein